MVAHQRVDLAGEERVGVEVHREYPLSRTAEALRRAERGGLAGKVVIVPDPTS